MAADQEGEPDYQLLKSGGDPYTYPNTLQPVIRNRYGLKDAAALATVERIQTGARLRELVSSEVEVSASLDSLQAVHAYIFGDVYPWAGHIRRVNFYKSEPVLSGASVDYSAYQNIHSEASAALDSLRARDWPGMSLEERAQTLSQDVAELWRVHPFREGNTRTVLAFADAYTAGRGMQLDVALLGQHADYVRASLVVATYGRVEDLAHIVKDALQQGEGLVREKRLKLDLTRGE